MGMHPACSAARCASAVAADVPLALRCASLQHPHACSLRRDRRIPALVEALRDKTIVACAGGWRHTMAADADGTLWAWGWNKVWHVMKQYFAPAAGVT